MWIIPKLSSGLGNRLFQYACAEGLADKWNGTVKFLLSKCGPTEHGDYENIFKMFPTVSLEIAPPQQINTWMYFHESPGNAFTFQEFPAAAPVDLAIVTGSRQSERYFPRTRIEPSWSTLGYNGLLKEYDLDTNDKQKNTWWLHVRLGDYRILPHHYLNLKAYYLRAFQKIPRGSRILWASDEPEVYRNYLEKIAEEYDLRLELIREDDELKTMYILSHCKAGGIGSNSTFSWWAAYFSGGGLGTGSWYFPEIWGKELHGLPQARDIYSSWMTKLSVQ
jgi:hypothetical protein